MEKEVKKDVISVLTQALYLIKKQDFIGLKGLSNHVIHNASIYQDQDSIQVAVVIYALSKILERTRDDGKNISAEINSSIEKATGYLIDGKEYEYRNEIKKIFKEISEKDEKLLMYIQSVIDQANIIKGSKLYEHGISIGRVAEILGINQWDLMSYIGKTRIADEERMITDVTKRIAFTKKLFKIT